MLKKGKHTVNILNCFPGDLEFVFFSVDAPACAKMVTMSTNDCRPGSGGVVRFFKNLYSSFSTIYHNIVLNLHS